MARRHPLRSADLGYVLTPPEFTVLIKWWCGMDVYDSVFACPSCGCAMDRAGYHALTCRHAGSLGTMLSARFFSTPSAARASRAARVRPLPCYLALRRGPRTSLPPTLRQLSLPALNSPSHTLCNPTSFNVRVCVAPRLQSSTKLL